MKSPTSDHEREANRRTFLKSGAGIATGLLAESGAEAQQPAATKKTGPLPMPTRNLGRTGYKVGIFSLGGQAAVEQPNNDKVAVPIVERALDLGINYIDTASSYGGLDEHGHWSERYIGQVMKRRRNETFLATKCEYRNRDGALRQLESSLKNLNTDHLDLWQLHNLQSDEDLKLIFGKDGALEALTHARDQKMTRFVGVTGHYRPEVLMEAIRRFPFDTVLMAINAADRHHFSFEPQLLPLALEKQMGIIGMKIPARSRLLSTWKPPSVEEQRKKSPNTPPVRTPGTITIREAMYYSLSMPVSTCIIGCDTVAHVEENVTLAREFTPLNPQQIAAISEKARPVADQGLFFRMPSPARPLRG
jgi:aryl-alcohol dehydrogenase-like predicted oxidoreductase